MKRIIFNQAIVLVILVLSSCSYEYQYDFPYSPDDKKVLVCYEKPSQIIDSLLSCVGYTSIETKVYLTGKDPQSNFRIECVSGEYYEGAIEHLLFECYGCTEKDKTPQLICSLIYDVDFDFWNDRFCIHPNPRVEWQKGYHESYSYSIEYDSSVAELIIQLLSEEGYEVASVEKYIVETNCNNDTLLNVEIHSKDRQSAAGSKYVALSVWCYGSFIDKTPIVKIHFNPISIEELANNPRSLTTQEEFTIERRPEEKRTYAYEIHDKFTQIYDKMDELDYEIASIDRRIIEKDAVGNILAEKDLDKSYRSSPRTHTIEYVIECYGWRNGTNYANKEHVCDFVFLFEFIQNNGEIYNVTDETPYETIVYVSNNTNVSYNIKIDLSPSIESKCSEILTEAGFSYKKMDPYIYEIDKDGNEIAHDMSRGSMTVSGGTIYSANFESSNIKHLECRIVCFGTASNSSERQRVCMLVFDLKKCNQYSSGTYEISTESPYDVIFE